MGADWGKAEFWGAQLDAAPKAIFCHSPPTDATTISSGIILVRGHRLG